MVLAELWFTFLPQRGAVAGGLGVHPVVGQPGNYEALSFTLFLPPVNNSQLKDKKVDQCGLTVP